MQTNDRLRFIRKSLKKTQEEFAQLFSITQAGYSRIERGEIELTSDKIHHLLNYNVNLNWLISGLGDPFTTDSSNVQKEDNITGQGSQVDILLRAVDKLSESEKTNNENIKELIAQGRQQTDNITKLVDLLCQNGVSVSLANKKGGELSNQEEHDNDTHDNGKAV